MELSPLGLPQFSSVSPVMVVGLGSMSIRLRLRMAQPVTIHQADSLGGSLVKHRRRWLRWMFQEQRTPLNISVL